jgi:hypothetical protein
LHSPGWYRWCRRRMPSPITRPELAKSMHIGTVEKRGFTGARPPNCPGSVTRLDTLAPSSNLIRWPLSALRRVRERVVWNQQGLRLMQPDFTSVERYLPTYADFIAEIRSHVGEPLYRPTRARTSSSIPQNAAYSRRRAVIGRYCTNPSRRPRRARSASR